MNRRSFLRGIILTTGGLILPTAAQALILGDRYHRLVESIRAVLDGAKIEKACWATGMMVSTGPCRKQERLDAREAFNAWEAFKPEYTRRFETMMMVLLEDFGDMTSMTVDPDGTKEKINKVFCSETEIDILSEDDLRRHEDVLVVIGVMRTLTVKDRVPIITHGQHCAALIRWIKQYGQIYNAA